MPRTISQSVWNGNVELKYSEVLTGTQRGIDVWIKGQANSKRNYAFSPNPHDATWYNKNQVQFYSTVATAILDFYVRNNSTYPRYGWQLTVRGTSYMLNER